MKPELKEQDETLAPVVCIFDQNNQIEKSPSCTYATGADCTDPLIWDQSLNCHIITACNLQTMEIPASETVEDPENALNLVSGYNKTINFKEVYDLAKSINCTTHYIQIGYDDSRRRINLSAVHSIKSVNIFSSPFIKGLKKNYLPSNANLNNYDFYVCRVIRKLDTVKGLSFACKLIKRDTSEVLYIGEMTDILPYFKQDYQDLKEL